MYSRNQRLGERHLAGLMGSTCALFVITGGDFIAGAATKVLLHPVARVTLFTHGHH